MSEAEARADFNKFWESWPERTWGKYPENKEAAWNVWKAKWQSGRLPLLEELEASLALFKAEDERFQGGRYVPLLRNWLNREAWKEGPRKPAKTETNDNAERQQPLCEFFDSVDEQTAWLERWKKTKKL